MVPGYSGGQAVQAAAVRVWRAVREGGATCRLTAKPTSAPFTHALVPLVNATCGACSDPLSEVCFEAFQSQRPGAHFGACAAQTWLSASFMSSSMKCTDYLFRFHCAQDTAGLYNSITAAADELQVHLRWQSFDMTHRRTFLS